MRENVYFSFLEMDEIASTSSVNVPERDLLGGRLSSSDGRGTPPACRRSRQGSDTLRPRLSPAPRRAEVA